MILLIIIIPHSKEKWILSTAHHVLAKYSLVRLCVFLKIFFNQTQRLFTKAVKDLGNKHKKKLLNIEEHII